MRSIDNKKKEKWVEFITKYSDMFDTSYIDNEKIVGIKKDASDLESSDVDNEDILSNTSKPITGNKKTLKLLKK